MKKHSVIIEKSKCVGCTTCIKACPNEAIRVRERKAKILDQRCIDCGVCISRCPHSAIRSVHTGLEVLEKYKWNVALPDQALFGQFTTVGNPNVILTALLDLGFDDICEPAASAELIAQAAIRESEAGTRKQNLPLISSCCPTILRLIRMRFSELIPHVVDTVIPIEHAAMLARDRAARQTGLRPEEIGIIAIVPCPSQITEAQSPELLDAPVIDETIPIVDIFSELESAIKKVDHPLALCKSGRRGLTHAYSGGEATARKAYNFIAVDEIQNCIRMLEEIENGNIPETDYIELNACTCGCVGGSLCVGNPFNAKLRIKKMLGDLPEFYREYDVSDIGREQIYASKKLEYLPAFLLDEDRSMAFEKLTKIREIRQRLPGIDCGGCGAPSCNAFAEDVVQEKAQLDQCVFRRGNNDG